MDWDSKLSQWEIPELETSHLHPNQITLNPISINSSPSQFHQITLKDCSIDLKLGGGTDQSGAATCPKGVQPPVKRARGPTNQAQMIVSCSVDGCGSDLSSCRDYHRRHKVCESHSKTPVVLVGGKEQRFCQQCSRFHMLTEFDEVKRSCRKRLDGHNRRRRKPQPDSVNNHHTSLLSNHNQVSQFSNYTSVFRTSIPEATWSSPGSKTLISKNLISHPYLARAPTQPPFSLSFPQNLKETKCFPFLYDSSPTSNPNFSSESSGSSSGGGNSNKIIYSECALSLLSSSPPPSATAPAALSVSVGPTCQSLYPGYQYPGPPSVTGTGFHMEDLDSDSRIGIETGNGSLGFHCQDMFVSNEGPGLGDGASHVLPFWHH